MLELVFFEHRAAQVQRAIAAGFDACIVDWESRGKHDRQDGVATEIDPGTLEDLRSATTAAGPGRVHCRLNALGPWTQREVEDAIQAGAACLLLPMVRSLEEVEKFLKLVDGRCRTGMLVETTAAVAAARDLATFPLERIYVGLNDLAIDRRSSTIFDAMVDGTVQRLRETFSEQEFAVAGVTVVDCGEPIPCAILLAEMERLGATFSFCRRSFKKDVADRDWKVEIERIRNLWRRLESRSSHERHADRQSFHELVKGLQAAPPTIDDY